MCEQEADKQWNRVHACMYTHMHLHVCTQLFMNIIIYGQENVECNHMLNSIQIISNPHSYCQKQSIIMHAYSFQKIKANFINLI